MIPTSQNETIDKNAIPDGMKDMQAILILIRRILKMVGLSFSPRSYRHSW